MTPKEKSDFIIRCHNTAKNKQEDISCIVNIRPMTKRDYARVTKKLNGNQLKLIRKVI